LIHYLFYTNDTVNRHKKITIFDWFVLNNICYRIKLKTEVVELFDLLQIGKKLPKTFCGFRMEISEVQYSTNESYPTADVDNKRSTLLD